VIVSDTAGIRENAGKVESLGIERSFKTAHDADLVVVLREASTQGNSMPEITGKPVITVLSKIDLGDGSGSIGQADFAISCKSGMGIDVLVNSISIRAKKAVGDLGDVLPSRKRHILELQSAVSRLETALAGNETPLELRAEDLRIASDHLGRIIGKVDVEDLLDVIFGTFCIGK
jgi:tRNA modification GTPase